MGVSEGIFKELHILALALLFGGGLAAVYDIIRICRRVITRGIFLVSLEDIIYWIFACIVTFAFFFQVNSGGIRGYIVGGIAIGAALYHFLLGKWIIKGVSYLTLWVKKQLKNLKKAVTIILEKRFK